MHIAHQYDDDNHPWPIEIEDHYGRLHAVNLEPGQVRLCADWLLCWLTLSTAKRAIGRVPLQLCGANMMEHVQSGMCVH